MLPDFQSLISHLSLSNKLVQYLSLNIQFLFIQLWSERPRVEMVLRQYRSETRRGRLTLVLYDNASGQVRSKNCRICKVC